MVEMDLRLLLAEMKKVEGPVSSLMGMLHHSELPAIKDAAERALHKLRGMPERQVRQCQVGDRLSSASFRHANMSVNQFSRALQEILVPFSLACDTKYPKLASIAVSTFQKLLANDAVSSQGRSDVIKALHSVGGVPGWGWCLYDIWPRMM